MCPAYFINPKYFFIMKLFDLNLFCKGEIDTELIVSVATLHCSESGSSIRKKIYILYDSSTGEYDSFPNFNELMIYISQLIRDFDFDDLPF